MTTKLIIIVSVSVAVVVGMFIMGKFLDRTSSDNTQPDGEKE